MLKGQKLQKSVPYYHSMYHHMQDQNFPLHAAALYAVKINALYTLLVQFNVALKCFTVQLQKMFNKDFPLFNAQKGC